jgi:hypothetical protein
MIVTPLQHSDIGIQQANIFLHFLPLTLTFCGSALVSIKVIEAKSLRITLRQLGFRLALSNHSFRYLFIIRAFFLITFTHYAYGFMIVAG